MRYALIRKMDISNGKGIGVSLFVQGCHIHCKGCFNRETWDFSGGKEWNEEIKNKFFQLIDKPFIVRISFLGGDPLAYENLPDVYNLIKEIKTKFPDKDIWLYTGYELKIRDFDATVDVSCDNGLLRNHILAMCDIVVDGPYVEEQRDLTLAFRGSRNQRIIDVQKTLTQGEIVLWNALET